MIPAEELYVNYALRNQFNTAETMAFFPGTVLASLHTLMGEVREIMSIMAILTQVLVTAGVLSGMVILLRLFSRRIALLRALGAPASFVFSAVWFYASILIVTGALLGTILGHVAATLISGVVTARTDILVEASLGWPEMHLIGGFVSVTMLLALLPASLALTRSVIADHIIDNERRPPARQTNRARPFCLMPPSLAPYSNDVRLWQTVLVKQLEWGAGYLTAKVSAQVNCGLKLGRSS